MNQNKYELKKSIKTRFLNIFRLILTIPFIDHFIAEKSSINPTYFWKKVVPPDYLYSKNSLRNTIRDGIKFALDISNNVEHSIYFFGLREDGFNNAFDDIRKSKVILDIGGFIGTAAIIFTRQNPSSKIYSFEPNPETYSKAVALNRKNGFTNVQLINSGVGNEPGKLKLYKVHEHNSGMSRILKGEQDYPFFEVDITTIDKFVNENKIDNIDFIKIDVEGFEYSVLKGGESTLLKHHPTLFIELSDDNLLHNGTSALELIRLLNTYGYSQFLKAKTSEPVDENTDFSHCHYDIIARFK